MEFFWSYRKCLFRKKWNFLIFFNFHDWLLHFPYITSLSNLILRITDYTVVLLKGHVIAKFVVFVDNRTWFWFVVCDYFFSVLFHFYLQWYRIVFYSLKLNSNIVVLIYSYIWRNLINNMVVLIPRFLDLMVSINSAGNLKGLGTNLVFDPNSAPYEIIYFSLAVHIWANIFHVRIRSFYSTLALR